MQALAIIFMKFELGQPIYSALTADTLRHAVILTLTLTCHVTTLCTKFERNRTIQRMDAV